MILLKIYKKEALFNGSFKSEEAESIDIEYLEFDIIDSDTIKTINKNYITNTSIINQEKKILYIFVDNGDFRRYKLENLIYE